MNKFEIPISKPNLNDKDFQEIKRCFYSSWISSKSPWVDKFEKEFAKKISGTRYGVAVNSGTSALFLALKALDIGPGDEVILPSLTMIATINAVYWVGAKPVLVDSTSIDDWNINIKEIKTKISKKTKAIIPVHLYGYPCDMDEINKIAKNYNLFIIEDAAEAMGSFYKNKIVGSLGNISCFSLYINKIITSGNGGMICVNNKKIYQLLKKIRFFDFNEKIHFKHYLIGYNFALSGLLAALATSQIKRFNHLLKKRRLVFQWYKDNLRTKKARFIEPPVKNNPNFWFPAIIFNNKKQKENVIKKLFAHNIETRKFFLPIHLQPAYKNFFKNQKYPISEYFFQHGLLLPSYYDLDKKTVCRICRLIDDTVL